MIILCTKDIEFMLEALVLPPHLKKELENLRFVVDKVVSDTAADELRDLCTDKLDMCGFDANYMPTKEGEKLEALIDKLFVG